MDGWVDVWVGGSGAGEAGKGRGQGLRRLGGGRQHHHQARPADTVRGRVLVIQTLFYDILVNDREPRDEPAAPSPASSGIEKKKKKTRKTKNKREGHAGRFETQY